MNKSKFIELSLSVGKLLVELIVILSGVGLIVGSLHDRVMALWLMTLGYCSR